MIMTNVFSLHREEQNQSVSSRQLLYGGPQESQSTEREHALTRHTVIALRTLEVTKWEL